MIAVGPIKARRPSYLYPAVVKRRKVKKLCHCFVI
jgi:hypothetical protein